MAIDVLIKKNQELRAKFSGLRFIKEFFPEEYARLESNLILDDDTLFKLDRFAIELIDRVCFPCFDPYYDFQRESRERPYLGLEKISILPMGYSPGSYCIEDMGFSLYFVNGVCQEHFDYFGYDLTTISQIKLCVESIVREWHPLKILPLVIQYVWALTGNLWLDSTYDSDCDYHFSVEQVQLLWDEYRLALQECEKLRFFDAWFNDNRSFAIKTIEHIFHYI
jgi:hypothetical protein